MLNLSGSWDAYVPHISIGQLFWRVQTNGRGCLALSLAPLGILGIAPERSGCFLAASKTYHLSSPQLASSEEGWNAATADLGYVPKTSAAFPIDVQIFSSSSRIPVLLRIGGGGGRSGPPRVWTS